MDGVSRCGFVALCGKPNVGKSTLFNRLVGAPLAAATGRPQTTRHNIRGVLTEGAAQFVFVDTPGLAAGRARRLSRLLNANARAAYGRVDAALLVVEAGVWNARDEAVADDLARAGTPVMLCVNKIDRLPDRARLLPYLAALAPRGYAAYVPVSARAGEGLDALKRELARLLPPGPHRFDPEQLSDRPERFFAAERIREQLLVHLREELPYAAHVRVGRYAGDGPRVRVEAQILVERPSQRAILLGRGGARLGAIGRGARLGLERLLERPVALRLHVRVAPRWLRDPRIQAGYRGEA